MHKSFEGVTLSGIVKPGETYVLCENLDSTWQVESLDYLYTIRSEAEILVALDMEMTIISEIFQLIKYLGFRRVSEDCHEFRMLCYDEEGTEMIFSLYLHRITTLEEKLRAERENGVY